MFWRERIAKENTTLDMIDELHAAQRRSGQHYSQKGGPILRDDISDTASEARSVALSVARSVARSDSRSEARSGGGRGDQSDTRSEVRSVAPSRAPTGSVYGSQYGGSSRHTDDGRSGAAHRVLALLRARARACARVEAHFHRLCLSTRARLSPRSAYGRDVDPLV
jgi:hypothetical protein